MPQLPLRPLFSVVQHCPRRLRPPHSPRLIRRQVCLITAGTFTAAYNSRPVTSTFATDTTTVTTTTVAASVSTVPIPDGFQYPTPTPGAPQKRAISPLIARGGALINGRTTPTTKSPHCSGSPQKYPSKVTCYKPVETFIPTTITQTAKKTTTTFAPTPTVTTTASTTSTITVAASTTVTTSTTTTTPVTDTETDTITTSTEVHLHCQSGFQEVLISPSASLKQRPTLLPLPALTMPLAPLPPTRSAVIIKAAPSNSSIPATLRIRTSRRTAHTIAAWRASRHPIASAPTMARGLWATAASWKWVPPAPHPRAILLATIAMEEIRL